MAQDVLHTRSNDPSLASLRRTKHFALVIAIITFLLLVVSFGWRWEPYEQIVTGLLCYVSYMWHRRLGQRLAEAEAAARQP
jgi:hypothetical protein